MDLESLKDETSRRLLRTGNSELIHPELPRSNSSAMSTMKSTWAEKSEFCAPQNDIHPIRHQQPKCSGSQRNSLSSQMSSEPNETLLHWIESTSIDMLAMVIAAVCIFLIHQHESMIARLQEGKRILPDKEIDRRRSGDPPIINDHSAGKWTEFKPALALESFSTSRIWEAITNFTSQYTITNPPPLLFLLTTIIFAISLAHLLHSQKKKKYRFRNHILCLEVLLGTIVGVWKTGENFLMQGKAYVVMGAVLGCTLSWVGHVVLGVCERLRNEKICEDDCACVCEGG